MVQRGSCAAWMMGIAGALGALSAAASGQTPRLSDLGALGEDARAYAVSADGTVVVGESDGQGFAWSAGTGMVALGGARATGVSRHGEVVCGFSGPGGGASMRSVRWTDWAPSAMTDLNTFGDGGYSAASGISADANIIVGNAFDGDFDTAAYRWSSGGTAMVGAGGYTAGVGTAYGAQAASADGTVIVGNTGVGQVQAFRWTGAGGTVAIVTGAESSAQAVSADGTVVVGYVRATPGAGRTAFRWSSAGPGPAISLPDLPGSGENGTALGVSADGATIVGWGTSDAGVEAFVWDATSGTRNLREALVGAGAAQAAGWTLTSATGISADGTVIVGYGTDPEGRARAWRAVWGCYANCDGSAVEPVLNALDFSCFLRKFATGDPYANCDGSTLPPFLSVGDFTCYLQRYTAGCS